MEEKSVAALLNNCLQLDVKEMDVQLAENFFQKQEHKFLPMTAGAPVNDLEDWKSDGKNNIYIMPTIPSGPLENWELPSLKLSNILNSIATMIEKKSALFAQIDYAIRGISQKDTQHFDIAMIVACFRYYANSSGTQNYPVAFVPLKVYEVPLSNVSPLVFLGWLVAPALALKCTVNIVCAVNVAAVATLFAQLCFEAGLPADALNVYPCSDDYFTCIPPTCLKYKDSMLEMKESLVYPKLNRGTMIVCESADLDSAVDVIFEAAWSHNGMLPWSLRRILVQESVTELFKTKLSLKLKRLELNKVTCGKLHEDTAKAVTTLVNALNSRGIKHLDIHESFNEESQQNVLKPIFYVDNVPLTAEESIFDRDVPLPIVLIQPFRSTKEAIAMINSKRTLAVWIKCERLTMAYEISVGINANFVWLNSHGLFSFYVNGCTPLVEEKYTLDVSKRIPLLREMTISVDPKIIIEKVAKSHALWKLKSPEEQAQVFRNIAYELFRNRIMYNLKQVFLYSISDIKARLSLEKSIKFLQYAATECLRPSSHCTVVNKTLHWKLRVPIGTVAIHPCYDMLHELIISVAAVTLRGNAVLYNTRSPLIIELSKYMAECGIPIVVHSDFKFSHVKFNDVKHNWSLPDYCLPDTCNGDKEILRLFDVAQCKEVMDRRFSYTKSTWSAIGETYAN